MTDTVVYYLGVTGNYDNGCLWIASGDPRNIDTLNESEADRVWQFAIVPHDETRWDLGVTLEIPDQAFTAFVTHPGLFTALEAADGTSEEAITAALRTAGAVEYRPEVPQ